MPESLDNPNALTMRKILDLDPNDPRVLKVMADAKGDAKRFHEEYVVPLNKRIAKAFPWFSGTDSDWTKIEALLSLKLAKPFNWFGDTLSAELGIGNRKGNRSGSRKESFGNRKRHRLGCGNVKLG